MKTFAALAVALACLTSAASADWFAYNDFGGTASTGNVTNGTSGTLVNFADGSSTGVSFALAVSTAASTPVNAAEGTDFYNVFDGKLNMAGGVYANVNTTLTITGLDPAALYELVLAPNRGGYSYGSRYTITDMDAFTNASTAGAAISTLNVADDTVTIASNNTTTGYVGRWTGIQAGADGDVVIAIAGSPTNWYLNGMMLAQVPEPATLTVLALGGLSLLARRRTGH